MDIFLAIVTGILLFGMIGENEPERQSNYTFAFVTTVAAILLMKIIG